MVPLLFPGGTLMVGPSLTPSTVFDTASGTWQTKQTVAVGAVNLTDISFISAAVAALPASTGVRASVHPPLLPLPSHTICQCLTRAVPVPGLVLL